MAVSVEIVPDAVDALPAGDHLSVLVKEIPGAVHIPPAGGHCAVAAHEIPVSAVLQPAGVHHAVAVGIIPGAVRVDPALGQSAAAVQIVPLVVLVGPARGHTPAVLQEEAFAALIQPAGTHHGGVMIHEIPGPVIVHPAGGRRAGAAQVIPFTVLILPAVLHLSGAVVQIIALAGLRKPALLGKSVPIHVVPAVAVVDPGVLLHGVVLIIVSVPADGPPQVGRYDAGEILKLEIDVHIAADSVHRAGAGGLPHHRGGVSIHRIVPGHPHRIIHQGHIQLVLQPVFIGIDNRIIPCVLDPLAERVCNGRQLLLGERALGAVLHVKGHGVGNRVVLDQIQDKIRFLDRHLGVERQRIDVHADLNPRVVGLLDILVEIRIHRALGTRPQHDEGNVVRRHLPPVHIPLPAGDVDSPVQHVGDGGAVMHLVDPADLPPGVGVGTLGRVTGITAGITAGIAAGAAASHTGPSRPAGRDGGRHPALARPNGPGGPGGQAGHHHNHTRQSRPLAALHQVSHILHNVLLF